MTKTFSAIAIVLASCATAQAQDPFYDVINAIVTTNPDLANQQQLVIADAADAADENSLANPEFGFSRVWGAKGIGNKLQLDLSQSFDWPGLYAMRGHAAKSARSAAEMLVLDSRLRLSADASTLLIELVYVRKQIALQKEIIANMEGLGAAIDKSLANGEITALDQRKQRIELFKAQSGLSAMLARESQIIASVNALGDGSAVDLSQITAYPIMPEKSAEEYKEQVVAFDPLYASQQFSAEQEAFNAKAAVQSRFPSFTVGYQHQAEMGDRFNGFTLGVTLPFFENRHARTSAVHRRVAAEQSQRALLASRYAEIDGLLKESALWKAQMNAYDDVFGDNAYLSMAKKVYDQGEMTTLDYIAEVQYYTEATMAYLEVEQNYYQSLATLNKYSHLMMPRR